MAVSRFSGDLEIQVGIKQNDTPLPKLGATNESKLSPEGSESSIKILLRTPGKLINRGYGLDEYDPGLPVINRSLARVKPGIVLKFPHHPWWLLTPEQVQKMHCPIHAQSYKDKFEREKRVFEILGNHPRIVR